MNLPLVRLFLLSYLWGFYWKVYDKMTLRLACCVINFKIFFLIAWFGIKHTIEFHFISSDIFLRLIIIRIRQKIWDISVWIRSFEGSGRCFSSDASFLYYSQFQPSSIYVGILEQKMKLRIVDRLRCTFYLNNIKELQNGIW